MKLATGQVVQSSPGMFENTRFYSSNRTGALVAAIQLTNQDPADYNLKQYQALGNLWTVPSEADENDAVRKFQDFWNHHKDQYVGVAATQPDTAPAATRPARINAPDTPSAAPRRGNRRAAAQTGAPAIAPP